jgi:hypothetical protein
MRPLNELFISQTIRREADALDALDGRLLNPKFFSEKTGKLQNSLALFIRLSTIPITWCSNVLSSVTKDDLHNSVVINFDLESKY